MSAISSKKVVTEFLIIVATCLAAGACCGFIQGWIGFTGGDSYEDRFGVGILSASLGGLVALVLGPLLFYTLLRRRLTFELGVMGILTCLFVGAVTAWSLTALTKIGGWLSMFVTPIVAILLSILIRLFKNRCS